MNKQVKIDGVVVTMATPVDVVKANIKANTSRPYALFAHQLPEWRYGTAIAVVGGGPSLANNLEKVRNYKVVIACGSVHDYLITNGIIPTYTIVCDPDPLVNEYLKKPHVFCTYLVATQCSPKTFSHLSNKFMKVARWHAGGDHLQNQEVFPENSVIIGGGCTVGTRAIVMAINFGYNNLHLFGFDSCIHNDKSHAYEFSDPVKEKIEGITDITVGDIPFKVAPYMLGQIMDFKRILELHGKNTQFIVHGEGALYTLMQLGKKAASNG